jgi:hypothetical protein
MKLRAFLYAIIISLLPVSAQVCIARTEMVKMLEEKYKEQMIGRGIAGRSMVEVFVSEEGSFTVFYTSPNGVSCFIGAGRDWQTEVIRKGTGL